MLPVSKTLNAELFQAVQKYKKNTKKIEKRACLCAALHCEGVSLWNIFAFQNSQQQTKTKTVCVSVCLSARISLTSTWRCFRTVHDIKVHIYRMKSHERKTICRRKCSTYNNQMAPRTQGRAHKKGAINLYRDSNDSL